MTIPPRFLDDLRNRLTLSDEVGKTVKLTRAGREYKGCCPFHKEKTASFYVNNDKQFYHCFGCGAHGDVIGFAMQAKNLSFIEALEGLAAQAGMQVPQASPEEVKKEKKKKDLYALMESATNWMAERLFEPKNKDVLSYMTGRGFKQETLEAFTIGYAPDDGQAIRRFLNAEGYDDSQMLEVGLIKKSVKGGEPYAFFRDRLMFPVRDRRGRVVAFGGRVLPENIRPPTNSDFTPPKYINSSDTPLFNKGRMLYGDSLARQAARQGHTPIVVEGYLDVMACHQAGIEGAVAPLGTAMTEDQIMLVWSMCNDEEKTPVLCFDGDNAGRRAASRACERILPLLKPNQSVLLAFLPEGEDPDTFIKAKGRNSFVDVLKQALPLNEFIWMQEVEGRDLKSPEAKAGLSARLELQADSIADRTVQRYYRQAFRDKLWEAFRFNANSKGGKNPKQIATALLKKPVKASKADEIVRRMIATFATHPQLLLSYQERLYDLQTGRDEHLDLLNELLQFNELNQQNELDFTAVKDHLIEAGFEGTLDALHGEHIYIHAPYARASCEDHVAREAINELFEQLEREQLHSEIGSARQKMNEDFSEDSQNRLFEMRKLLGGNKE